VHTPDLPLSPHSPVDDIGTDCRQFEVWLASFVADGLAREDRLRMRRHVVDCATCASRYHESLTVAAHIGHERRVGREEAEKLRRRRQRLSDARGIVFAPRSFFVRTVVVPGLLIFLLARGSVSETQARVRTLQGTTFLGERELSPAVRPQLVRRGDWIVTPAGGSATIESEGGAGARIDSNSSVCVEDSKLQRLLLHGGRITVDAPCTVNSRFGAIEISEGSAILSLDAQSLLVEVLTGSALAVNAHGARRLAAGESARLSTTGL
jgi:hypothetical protein